MYYSHIGHRNQLAHMGSLPVGTDRSRDRIAASVVTAQFFIVGLA